MFIGSFKYSIDSKGRISIPAKMRKYVNPEAGDTFVMTRSTTARCLEVYPMDRWKELTSEKLSKLNSFNPQESQFIRMFLQEAAEDTLDTQSRLLIPKNLIEFAGINKEVLILGVVKKIEVWNPEIYDEYLREYQSSFPEVAKEVMK